MISFNSTFLVQIIKKKPKQSETQNIFSHFMSTCMAIFFFLLLPPLKSL